MTTLRRRLIIERNLTSELLNTSHISLQRLTEEMVGFVGPREGEMDDGVESEMESGVESGVSEDDGDDNE